MDDGAAAVIHYNPTGSGDSLTGYFGSKACEVRPSLNAEKRFNSAIKFQRFPKHCYRAMLKNRDGQ